MDLNSQDVQLARGAHSTPEEGLCTLEVVAMLAGEGHTDQPECCCPAIGSFVFRWNDDLKDDERTTLLLPLTTRLVGSVNDEQITWRRAILAIDWLLRSATPDWLEAIPEYKLLGKILRKSPPLFRKGATRQASGVLKRINLALPQDLDMSLHAQAVDSVGRSGAAAAYVDLPCLGADLPALAGVAVPALSVSVNAANRLLADGHDIEPLIQKLQASGVELVDRMIAMQ